MMVGTKAPETAISLTILHSVLVLNLKAVHFWNTQFLSFKILHSNLTFK